MATTIIQHKNGLTDIELTFDMTIAERRPGCILSVTSDYQ